MCQKNQQAHDGNILRKKEQDRPFKIKENKGGCQKHIGQKLIFHESIKALPGHQGRSYAQKDSQRFRSNRPGGFTHHAENHIPV